MLRTDHIWKVSYEPCPNFPSPKRGIRFALGATRSHVLIQIIKQGLQLTALGVTIGLAGALAVNRLIASLLFGVQPTDTVTIAFVIATITALAAVASWLPAWRASARPERRAQR